MSAPSNKSGGVSGRKMTEDERIMFEAMVKASEDVDKGLVFGTESERKRLFHAARSKSAQFWTKPKPCLHRGCTKYSISRSHAIPMAASIETIAEGGHVISPVLQSTGVIMRPVGVRLASTFPGFCEEHENLFADYEQKKEINAERHYALQAYRTLCREIARMRHQIDRLSEDVEVYVKLRNNFMEARVSVVAPGCVLKNYSGDEVENRAREGLLMMSDDLKELSGAMYDEIYEYIENGTGDPALIGGSLTDCLLPVCLSGMGILNYKSHLSPEPIRAICILGIIPDASSTHFYIMSERKHEEAIGYYLENMPKNSHELISMFESWMCNGTDHWFMRPSEWNAIPAVRQNAIIDALQDLTLSIAHSVPFSVLDSTRNWLIESGAIKGQVLNDALMKMSWNG